MLKSPIDKLAALLKIPKPDDLADSGIAMIPPQTVILTKASPTGKKRKLDVVGIRVQEHTVSPSGLLLVDGVPATPGKKRSWSSI